MSFDLGGCVVMGVGVTPEKYLSFIEGTANQDFLVIGAKGSRDACYFASKMSGEILEPKSLSISGLEMEVFLVKSEK
jgi:hypothetical protein